MEKVTAPASTVAQTLFRECVETPIPETRELFPMDADAPGFPTIKYQIRLYQFASVLLALLDAERRDSAFAPVVASFEAFFFPATFAEGAERLEEVRYAMGDLASLLQPDGKGQPMSWAHNCVVPRHVVRRQREPKERSRKRRLRWDHVRRT